MKRHIILLLFFGTLSCARISSGGFWIKFRQSEIVSKELDHGLYGGKTEIHWKGNKVFKMKQIIEFSKVNDWDLIDTTKVNVGFSNQILKYRFDASELQDKTILYLKSNLLTINEDKKLETQVNCFAILNARKDELIVYHYWGDF